MNREKENSICVLCRKRGQESRSSFYFTQCAAELRNTLLPGAGPVLLTTGKQHSSPGLRQLVTASLCLSYRLEIKIQFNVWRLLISQYAFSRWAFIAAAVRDAETHDTPWNHLTFKNWQTTNRVVNNDACLSIFFCLATVKLKGTTHIKLPQICLFYFYLHLIFFSMNTLDLSGFHNPIPLRSILYIDT